MQRVVAVAPGAAAAAPVVVAAGAAAEVDQVVASVAGVGPVAAVVGVEEPVLVAGAAVPAGAVRVKPTRSKPEQGGLPALFALRRSLRARTPHA